MQIKRGIDNFAQSEPEFLMGVMDRHKDWCVLVCLIGGGQEINKGEAGLLEWFSAIRKRFNHWHVYVPAEIQDTEYTRGLDFHNLLNGIKYEAIPDLFLKTSIRSFRSENVSKLVKSVLDCDVNKASDIFLELQKKYPVFVTRNITKAKEWLNQKARGSERFGLIASSKAFRLKPNGIFVELKIDPSNWFLNPKDDIRSSYFLEYVATEFDIQGLELDWTCVGWDADFRFVDQTWNYYQFRGKNWQKIRDPENMLYLKNAYRVLLTRARQGMIVFVPKGDEKDTTRLPEYYDGTYEYLKGIGFKELS